MKKRIIAALLIVTFFPAIAVAQEDEVPTQFVTMTEMDINAQRAKSFDLYRTKNPAKFDRLVRLKKSFLNNVRDSAGSSSLN